MKTSLTLAVALAVGLTTAVAARANSFMESVQFGPGPTDFSSATGTTGNPNNSSSLYYFDTNGGTLNSITFSASYTFSSSIMVTNSSSNSSSGSVHTESGAQFSSSASQITATLNKAVNTMTSGVGFGTASLTPVAFDLVGTSSAYNLAGGASANYTSQGSGSINPFTDTNASDLAAFSSAGGGTFVPLLSTLTGLSLTASSGNASASEQVTAQGSLVITYNYTLPNVPEPTSLVLLGVGLIGLGVFRRLR